MNKKTTTIYTGLYGKTAAKTLKLLLKQFKTYGGNMHNDGLRFTGQYSHVTVKDDGCVCIEVDEHPFNSTWGNWYQKYIEYSAYSRGLNNVKYIKEWFALQLESMLHGFNYTSDMTNIRLYSKSKTSPRSHVWEIRATAAALAGEDVKSKFGQKIFDKVVGKAADPVKTEVNAVIEEESRRICNDFRNKQNDIRNVLNQKICDLRKQYRKDIADLGKQCRKAISDMKKEMMAA